MRKLMTFLFVGLFFGSTAAAYAVQPLPEFMEDLNRWLGRDYTYYQNRWDPAAERFARFEDRMRHRVEEQYREGDISFSEYRHLRGELAAFDDNLRQALSDGRLSFREQRFLEKEQEHVRNDFREAMQSREHYYDEHYAPRGGAYQERSYPYDHY